MTIIESGLRPRTIHMTPFGLVRHRLARYLKRRMFNRLLNLDDRMLDDIGVTREEVAYVSRLPLDVNAGLELRLISERRRAGQKQRRR